MHTVATIVQAALLIPVPGLLLIGLITIYGQLRAREVPFTVAQLRDELG
jgi:hypothetical protein